jgi:hypothetical protein
MYQIFLIVNLLYKENHVTVQTDEAHIVHEYIISNILQITHCNIEYYYTLCKFL